MPKMYLAPQFSEKQLHDEYSRITVHDVFPLEEKDRLHNCIFIEVQQTLVSC